MGPLVARIVADVQGRLAFKGQAMIRDTVVNYKPQAGDLDYPAVLLMQVVFLCGCAYDTNCCVCAVVYHVWWMCVLGHLLVQLKKTKKVCVHACA